MLLLSGDSLICPSGKPGGTAIIVDLKEISRTESRIQDVRIANAGNSAELLSCFTLAWKDLHQHIVHLIKEKNDAMRCADQIKARIILDEVPSILKARGLWRDKFPSGSEDQRQACLDLSDEYQDALEKIDYITAVVELLKGKLTAFDMAFTSVKKILSGDTQGNFLAKVSPDPKGYNGFGVPR